MLIVLTTTIIAMFAASAYASTVANTKANELVSKVENSNRGPGTKSIIYFKAEKLFSDSGFGVPTAISDAKKKAENDLADIKRLLDVPATDPDPLFGPVSSYSGEAVPKALIPNIVSVTSKNIIGDAKVDGMVSSDLISLADALFKNTKQKLVINSSYRSEKDQEAIFAMTKTGYAAHPGESEHQLGTALDISVASKPSVKNWLEKNAYQYGFVRSFTKECEAETGVKAEEWHWRWISRDYAREYADFKSVGKMSCQISYLRAKTGRIKYEDRNYMAIDIYDLMSKNQKAFMCYRTAVWEKSVPNVFSVKAFGICEN